MGGLLCVLFVAGAAAGPARVAGVVVDGAGSPVPGALVTVSPSGLTVRSDREGRFAVEAPAGDRVTLAIEASGFQPWLETYPSGGAGNLRIVLARAGYSETVSVAATRTSRRISDLPESVVVVSSQDFAAAASPAPDQVLRQIPGFALFRRSDSRTANPTAQGVSLRGVGGSGASRTAVLDDGIPIDDPFGGWVYWSRVPLVALDRAETVRGGMSGLYGAAALSGVLQLVRREASPASVLFDGSFGTRETGQGSLYAGGREGPWGGRLAAEKFRTAGYVPVAPGDRGPVDREADSRHETLDVTLDRTFEGNGRAFLRGATYDEARQNGTVLQVNDTRIRQLAAGADASAAGGEISARGFVLEETYHQTFSAISIDRRSESLTRAQRVPSTAGGVSLQWSRSLGAHLVVAGADAGEVRGSSDEDVFGARGVSFAGAGGRQRSEGAFLEDLWTPAPRLTVHAGVRLDAWRNFDGQIRTGATSGSASARPLPDRSESAVSPRASLLYRATASVSLTASAYRSFRAPTLNELYRTFRVGNVVTNANEALSAERATGAELGALATGSGGRVGVRANLFWMEIQDTIANVTISTTPALITRQRQNLGRTRSRGLELDASWRATDAVALTGGYLYADSSVVSFQADSSLEGRRIPQVPRHQAAFQVRYGREGGPLAALQAQLVGRAWEDDQNSLPLSGYATFDALASFPVARGLEGFLAAENLLDRRYDVGRTPVLTVAPGRAFRAGIRLRVQ